MKVNSIKLTNFDVICLFLINFFVLWSSFDFLGWYKTWLGADAYQYTFYLKYFLEGSASIGYEQGVHYFWFISLFVRPIWTRAITGQLGFSDAWSYHLGVIVGNTFIFFLLANIAYFFFKKIFNNREVVFLSTLNFLLITSVYYSRLQIKPDLLAILLFIIFLFSLQDEGLFTENNSKHYLIFSVFFGFMMSVKFTLTVISIFILIFYLFIHKKERYSIKKIFIFTIIVIVIATLLIVTSERATERFLWDPPRTTTDYSSAPLSYFTNFSLTKTYENPLRDNLKNSFLGIWLVDFYGDYWEVYFLDKGTALDLSETKISWARICFTISVIAHGFYLLSLVYKIVNKRFLNYDGFLIGACYLIAPVSLIIIETLLGWFKASEGEPTKTTYFGFLIVFFVMSVFSFLDETWNKSKYIIYVFTFTVILTRLPFLYANTLNITQTVSTIRDPLSNPLEVIVPHFDQRCIYSEIEAENILKSKISNTEFDIQITKKYEMNETQCVGYVFGSNYSANERLGPDDEIVLLIGK